MPSRYVSYDPQSGSRAGSTSASAALDAQLRSALLTLNDLPTGWTEDKANEAASVKDVRAPCGTFPLPARYVTFFARGGGVATLRNGLSMYSDAASAQTAYTEEKRLYLSCGSGMEDGIPFTVTGLSVSAVGDESFGIRVRVTAGSPGRPTVNVASDECYARVGKIVAVIVSTDAGTPDDQQLDDLCRRTVRKARAAGLT